MTHHFRDWSIFVVVHIVLIGENLFAPNGPLGDVLVTYPQWILQGLTGDGWQGLTAPGVYPVLALIPMFAGAWGWGPWFLFVLAVNGVAFAVARSHARVASLVWLGFIALLGPIAVGRVDVFTVAIGVSVIALTDSNPRITGALIAVATWVKVWPIVLGLSSLLTTRARTIAYWAFSVAAGIGVVAVAIGGTANVLGFLGDQQGRGIQVEAVSATPWLWDAFAGGTSSVTYSTELLTFEISGQTTALVASALTLLEALVLVALASRIVLHRVRMVGEITTHILGLALTTLISALIVFNKVGSPQFVSWLGVAVIALVAYWHPRWSPVLLGFIGFIAIATHVLYPYEYFDFLTLQVGPLVLITARNVAEVGLLAVAAFALLRELGLEELAQKSGD
ncbi:MAG: glycosyltransferase family 87 protein [Microbacteriaceae bacterium]